MRFECFAFQYQDFEWGVSRDAARRVILNSKKGILPSEKDDIIYADKILGEPCRVILNFTPKNELLFNIKIKWDTPAVGPKVKALMIEKHGEPLQQGEAEEKYIWFGSSEDETIALDYNSISTELYYTASDTREENNPAVGAPETIDRF
jgi:hypothetical protein